MKRLATIAAVLASTLVLAAEPPPKASDCGQLYTKQCIQKQCADPCQKCPDCVLKCAEQAPCNCNPAPSVTVPGETVYRETPPPQDRPTVGHWSWDLSGLYVNSWGAATGPRYTTAGRWGFAVQWGYLNDARITDSTLVLRERFCDGYHKGGDCREKVTRSGSHEARSDWGVVATVSVPIGGR